MMTLKYVFSFLILTAFTANAQNNGLNLTESEDNYAIIPDHSSMNLGADFTIQMWLNPRTCDQTEIILSEGDCFGNFSYNLRIGADSLLMLVTECTGDCNSDGQYKCSTPIDPNKCLFLSVVYTSTDVQVYFDGQLQPGFYHNGSHCGNLNVSTEPMILGAYYSLSSSYDFNADLMIDDLQYWDKVLTATEIQNYYAAPPTGSEANLILYYNFEEAISGNGAVITNDATSTGSALDANVYSTSSTSPINIPNECYELNAGIKNIQSLSFDIYPNPSNGLFKIVSEYYSEDLKIEIKNIEGKVIYQNIMNSSTKTIDLNKESSGTYFISLMNNEGLIQTSKFELINQ